MTAGTLQRALALAGVALLAAVLALALARRDDDARPGEPRAVPVEDGGWYVALAGSRGLAADAERTACGQILTARSLGVSHPVLPCGAKLYVGHGDREVLTEVIDRGPKERGRQFELTEALAERLGVDGTQEIRWRFATRG